MDGSRDLMIETKNIVLKNEKNSERGETFEKFSRGVNGSESHGKSRTTLELIVCLLY